MNRRKFIQNTALAALPLMLGKFSVQALPVQYATGMGADDNDNILVLIQLFGGNDGLNTIVPLSSYSSYFNARKNIAIPEKKIIPLSGIDKEAGMHPSFAGMGNLYNEGRLAVIQSVGYPAPDFSHFKSTDIWMSGAAPDKPEQTGWAARYLENKFAKYPAGFPNEQFPHPPAIQIGGASSLVFRGLTAPYSVNIADPDKIYNLAGGFSNTAPAFSAAGQLDFIKNLAAQTHAYSKVVKNAAEKAVKQQPYPDNNPLAAQLKIVAKLISGGLQTKMYMVSYDGFDTHAMQADAADPVKGRHADLLKVTGDAVQAFQNDLKQLGIAKRVTGMTISEFGRRIASNDSLGTDHGTAAPMFVFGENVKPGFYGKEIVIPEKVTAEDNLEMQFDFRSVYASVLKNWLGAGDAEMNNVFRKPYPLIDFI